MVTGGDGTLVPEASSAIGSQLVAEPRPGISDAVLVLEGVGVRFGGISALDDVSLTVEQGVICGLIGPNGAGKTTLFDVVSGVRTPNDGKVWFDGKDVTRMSAVARARRGLRRTFQRVQTFGWLSVEDNVLAATEWHGGGGGMLADFVQFPTRRTRERQRRERVAEVLEQCGLIRARHRRRTEAPVARRAHIGSRRGRVRAPGRAAGSTAYDHVVLRDPRGTRHGFRHGPVRHRRGARSRSSADDGCTEGHPSGSGGTRCVPWRTPRPRHLQQQPTQGGKQ
jgi:hypothetical protein